MNLFLPKIIKYALAFVSCTIANCSYGNHNIANRLLAVLSANRQYLVMKLNAKCSSDLWNIQLGKREHMWQVYKY